MSGRLSPGLCHWFQTRAVARAVARVCLVALALNLLAPIAWAASRPSFDLDTIPICHAPAPDDAPALPSSRPGDTQDQAPHCLLCVLFGGTVWVPQDDGAAVVGIAPRVIAAASFGADELFLPPRPSTLRPSPRGPPALI
jgi:hypothetical protein